MILEYSNFVRCTKEEAWQFITSIERRPEWIPFMEKCYFTNKVDGWVGSTYQEKEVFLNIPLNINYEIIAYEEYKLMRSRCFMKPFYPKVEVRMEAKEGGCQCALILDINLSLFALIPNRILKQKIDDIIMPLVNNFNEILEKESVLNKHK